ncbi:MAG: hypothetical protein LBS59_07045 [Puniceicoccales bacterium]|jgi:hypothetical protein|nr:hypothetical protein [Puniceicoccales bacterium]
MTRDALSGKHGEYDLVLANPPFGKKSSVTIVNAAGETEKESLVINRDDFWASTSNKRKRSRKCPLDLGRGGALDFSARLLCGRWVVAAGRPPRRRQKFFEKLLAQFTTFPF